MTTMDRTARANTTTTTPPTNGTVQFWDQMLQAAQQAGSDVAALNKQEFSGGSDLGAKPGGAGATVAAGISAAAGVISAMFMGGNFGLGVANAVNGSSKGQMEVTLVNYSSNPVVLYNCNPSNIDISNLPDPLGEGDNDVVVLTSGSSFGSSTSFELDFLIGAGTTSIPFSLTYAYTTEGNPGRWTVTASAGGCTAHPFPTALQMYGFSFTGTASYPSFSVYTSPIETGNGAMSIAIYDMATS